MNRASKLLFVLVAALLVVPSVHLRGTLRHRAQTATRVPELEELLEREGAGAEMMERSLNPRTITANITVGAHAGPQSETDIFIDPKNPQHIVGASNDLSGTTSYAMGVYESNDGGATWSTTHLPYPASISGAQFQADPAITIDKDGNVFFIALVLDSANSITIWSYKKPAGSSTWGTPVQIQAIDSDKEFVTTDLDPASPCAGNVYVGWDNNEGNQTLRVATSKDHGATYTTSAKVNDSSTGVIGAYPLVGPGGHVYVLWADYPNNKIWIDKSTNCGGTWGTDHLVHTWTLATGGGLAAYPPADPNRGISAFPEAAIDMTNGAHRGRIYVTFADQGPANDGINIYLRYSDDEGATWSTPKRVNDDATGAKNDQFMPRVAVDQSDGSVNVVFYDTRDDSTHVKTHFYYARSEDGGVTFLPNVKITTSQSNEATGGADQNGYGDYTGVAASGGYIHPLYTDSRTGTSNEDIWTATIVNGLSIGTSTLPDALVNVAYSQTLTGAGGTQPYTWSQNGLPSSLSLNASTGAITGTPVDADAGPHTVHVTLKDATNATVFKDVGLNVVYPPLSITTPSLPSGAVGGPYSKQVQGQGGHQPYAWSATGLPGGLAIGATDGLVSGMPTAAGTFNATVTLKDTQNTTVQQAYTIVVADGPLILADATLPNGQEGAGYPTKLIPISGGTKPYAVDWAAGYTPPSGLSVGLDSSGLNAYLNGSFQPGTAGVHHLQIRATDATPGGGQEVVKVYDLTILGPPLANPGQDRTVDPGLQTLDGSASSDPGGKTVTYQWTPPAGVTLSSNTADKPTCTLTAAKDYTFTLVVKAGNLTSQPANLKLTVRNVPPDVDAGPDQTVKPTDVVTLDGSKTVDRNLDAMTYSWKQVSGPTVTLDAPTTLKPKFTSTSANATYVMELTASDGFLTGKKSVTIKAGTGGGGGGGGGGGPVGCTCGSVPPAMLAFAGSLVAMLRRRRR